MKKNFNSIQDAVKYLQSELIKRKFIVHRYDAYSTNSVYLKLDFGAAYSIRISDHNGKRYLSYKFNVMSDINKAYWRKDHKGMWRYYCPMKKADIDNLVNLVVDNRKHIVEKYGECSYKRRMLILYNQSNNCKGFWEGAVEVKK